MPLQKLLAAPTKASKYLRKELHPFFTAITQTSNSNQRGNIQHYYENSSSPNSTMASLKGPGAAQKHDGSGLRIGIVHARWNTSIIEPLLEGAKSKLLAAGVKESNIVVQTVPGSWELPIAVQR